MAAVLGGKVTPCRASFGLWSTARDCVKTTYAGMQLEVYVFAPQLEVWVQNFRLRGPREVAFAINEPRHLMGMMEPMASVTPGDALPVFRPRDTADGPVRAFLSNPDNRRDLADLRLERGECLAVLSEQMIVRLRGGDETQLRARFDVIGALFARNRRAPAQPALVLEAWTVAVGEPGDAATGPHGFGGAMDDAEECRNCRRPLHRILSLDTQAPPLAARMAGVPRLPVATCLNCQTLSNPLLLVHEQGRWTVREQQANESFGEFPGELPARPVRLDPPARGRRTAKARHRLGGAPEWIQSDETPDCPRCEQPMTFLAQLDTDDRLEVQFGDDGRLYAFVCPRCVAVATLIQST